MTSRCKVIIDLIYKTYWLYRYIECLLQSATLACAARVAQSARSYCLQFGFRPIIESDVGSRDFSVGYFFMGLLCAADVAPVTLDQQSI